ncbi:synemin isoform X2 [Heterocephalus glaber]|uniref:Synemin isoform X2 n=1 Tax=Heterocephalus glaber TaxID=10181 RepID=A0AAX6PIC6_HETGA|nr:synemin isoform X2 [Heterocephalus glaber]
MLSWRLQTGPEKAELRDLNARLHDYVCRVRELERENQLLEEQLRGRRGEEQLWAEGQARFAEEARGLRAQLDALSWETALAEGERDALRRELRELRRLGAEESAARGRLDAELVAQRRELQEALGARAALEAVLGRLQAERHGLDAARERAVRELRARASALTVHFRARARPAAPPPRLRELHGSCALLAAESWRESVQLYEDEVRELELALRRGQESRREAEEEARRGAQEAESLQRQALELEQLRVRLEEELRRLREEHGLRAEERQRVIDCLEDEKEALTLAMAERLRDYQELVRVKTGLSLEVATYRALLEGESNPEILIWTEHIEDVPQDFRNTSYRYTDSVSQKNERNLFPKQKAPFVALNHSSTAYSNGYLGSQTTMPIGNTARRGFLASRYSASATTRHKDVYEKTVNSQTNFQTFSPTRGLVRNTDAQVRTFPDRAKTVVTSDAPMYLTKGSTVIQESCRDRWDSVTADASESTRSNERTIILQKKIEAKATREQESDRSGPIKMKPEEKMFDSKEKASEERNLRWEELTKLDKEARKRESQQMRGQAKGQESLKEKTVKDKEIPISLEVSQGSRSEVSPKDIQTPRKKAAGDSKGSKAAARETRFRLDTSDTASALQGDSMTETIAENIVTSILKQFSQSPEEEASANSFPDTKVTYVDRKELPGEERTTKTEIVVESKLTEDIDVSDEASLEYLLSKDVKEVGLKGKSAEQMIGDIINLGLKGREGRAKVVNVEIVEEPMSYVGGRKTEELSSPFQVEEVDDVSPGSRGLVEEEERDGESHVTFSVNQHQRTKQPGENVTHAEEVSEAGDSEGDQSYFVSTPDELPAGHDREDEGSVYGQIHIEEESTIRYSWQDEIVQGTWRRRQRDSEAGERDVQDVDVPAHSPGGDMGSAHWKEEASGEFHAEPTVIEKEIKIPHELHTSIRDTFSKEPREQLAEVIGKLEETLPERMKAELSTLTREGQGEPGSVSVDVKKLQTTGGSSVTLVAEVNLSQTVDADQLDLEGLSRDEADEIEKAVESVVRESLSKRQGQAPGSPDREDGGVSFKRWATRELYGTAGEGNDAGQASGSPEEPTAQGPVSATVEVSSPRGFMQSHVLEDLSQSVRHIRLGPTEVWRTEQVPHRGPTGEVVEVSEDHSQAASVRGASQCARHFTVGPSQSQVPTQVIFQGPDSAWQEAGGTEEPGLAELSADTDRGGRHSTFGAQQFHAEKEISFQGPVSGAVRAGDYFATKEPVSSQISVWHLQLSPKEGLREQIQFIVPPPDKAEGSTRGGSVHTAELPGPIDIRPQGHQATEQVVPQSMVSSTSQGTVHREGSTDVTQATHSYTSGRKILMTEKSTFQRVVSESPQEHDAGDMSGADMTSGVSRSFRHIQLGPTEARTSEHIVIHGPMFRTFALAGSQEPAEIGELADSSRTLGQLALGPKETSFTFQMDVSSRKAAPTWTQEAGTEAEAHSVSDHGAWRDAGSRKDWAAGVSAQASASDEAHQEEGTEQARFDKTVQLQRMVDQRSVISDEKKVALLYLDSEEEEGDGQWF